MKNDLENDSTWIIPWLPDPCTPWSAPNQPWALPPWTSRGLSSFPALPGWWCINNLPPPGNKALWAGLIQQLVSLNKALSKPYFWGGWVGWPARNVGWVSLVSSLVSCLNFLWLIISRCSEVNHRYMHVVSCCRLQPKHMKKHKA